MPQQPRGGNHVQRAGTLACTDGIQLDMDGRPTSMDMSGPEARTWLIATLVGTPFVLFGRCVMMGERSYFIVLHACPFVLGLTACLAFTSHTPSETFRAFALTRGRRSVASGLGAKVLRTVGIIWMIALG